MTRCIQLALLALAVGCLPEPVETVVLTPTSPEIEAALLAADARWEAAGVDVDRIQIGEGGAPVRLVPERGLASETRTTRKGTAFAGVRWVELNSLDPAMVAHELGHALGIEFHPDDPGEPGVADCAPGAPHRPLMCAHIGAELGEQDLSLACDAGPCSGFSPEI